MNSTIKARRTCSLEYALEIQCKMSWFVRKGSLARIPASDAEELKVKLQQAQDACKGVCLCLFLCLSCVCVCVGGSEPARGSWATRDFRGEFGQA